MTRSRLLAALDIDRVEEAIARAEMMSAIELRVSVAGLFWGDPARVARRAFHRLGMSATTRRNGILVFLAPWRRRAVIFADEGITTKVPATLWEGTVAALTNAFRDGRFTAGLVSAIETLGRELAPHFPPGRRENELPDTVDG